MKKFNSGGFSWSTFFGITSYKRNLSRKIGIPLTKSGRQRKAGSGDWISILITFLIDR